ncbi:hypothetical protein IFM89_003116 [Coptis chinensis]|uniref:Uncharacterized protein n=1 Tax=Coptis chinensis TaxID=261450 RepID=A0A835M8S1_9MAGN|nr:hypothetical protein IFM89_003116 [Coptis chinensis]
MDDEKRWCEAGFRVACGLFELNQKMNEEKYAEQMYFYRHVFGFRIAFQNLLFQESSATAFQIARYAGRFCIAQGQGTYFLSFFLAAKDFNYDWVAWLILCTCEEFYCNALQSKGILGLPSSMGGFVA